MRSFFVLFILTLLSLPAWSAESETDSTGSTSMASESQNQSWGKWNLTDDNPEKIKEFVDGFMREDAPRNGSSSNQKSNSKNNVHSQVVD